MMDVVAEMKARLLVLSPEHMEIVDESALHAGHVGAQSGGGHYQLTLVAHAFHEQNAVARHRLVYEALGDLMGKHIHALSITALAPDEL